MSLMALPARPPGVLKTFVMAADRFKYRDGSTRVSLSSQATGRQSAIRALVHAEEEGLADNKGTRRRHGEIVLVYKP